MYNKSMPTFISGVISYVRIVIDVFGRECAARMMYTCISKAPFERTEQV